MQNPNGQRGRICRAPDRGTTSVLTGLVFGPSYGHSIAGFFNMRIFAVIGLVMGLAGGATGALAEALGRLDLRMGQATHRMTIPDGSGGTDSYWAVGPVSILAVGPGGGGHDAAFPLLAARSAWLAG